MLSNRTRETTTTTGTGTISLAGAVSGYQTFVEGIGTGNVCYYVIEDSATGDWEIGIGTVTASPDTLSRDTVVESSNSDALVNFGAGNKNVWIDAVIHSNALAVNGLRITNGVDTLDVSIAANQVSFSGATGYAFNAGVTVGKLAVPSYTNGLSIYGSSGIDKIDIYHDETDAYFKTSDGMFVFQTDEGTNTATIISVYGKGIGVAEIDLYDEGNDTSIRISASGNKGFINTAGTTPGDLALLTTAHANITCFDIATSGETPSLQISGYYTGDALRTLSIDMADAADTVSFSGLEGYRFYGSGDADYFEVSFDGSNTNVKWNDGELRFETLEGTNADTELRIFGHGTGRAQLRLQDGATGDQMLLRADGNNAYISLVNMNTLHLEDGAGADVSCFANAASGETKSFKISGYFAAGALRTVSMDHGDADNTFSTSGVDAYRWYCGADYLEISDGGGDSNLYLTWNDGDLNLQTAEGTNTNSTVDIHGKGTGFGQLRLYDQDDAEYGYMYASSGSLFIQVSGSSPGALQLNATAASNIGMFDSATDGETPSLRISGYFSGGSKRTVAMDHSNADNVFSFSGVDAYRFYAGADYLEISDGGGDTDLHVRWNDGSLVFQTEEGTNTNSTVECRGKGTGVGDWRLYDEDNTDYLRMYSSLGGGFLLTVGASDGNLALQHTAHADVALFGAAADGETRELLISGYFAAASLRTLAIGCGVDADNVSSFDGTDAYRFYCGSDYLEISDGGGDTDLWIKWLDGSLNFQTEEGTNTNTTVDIHGKGTGYGLYRVYDENDGELLTVTCINGVGRIYTAGSSPGDLWLQHLAHANITMFESAASGETPSLQVSGYRAADAKRTLDIAVGASFDDTVDFTGLNYYWFTGTAIYLTGGTNPNLLLGDDAGPNNFARIQWDSAGDFLHMGTDAGGQYALVLRETGAIQLGDGGTTDYAEFNATGDLNFFGSAGFYPRRVSQAAIPANGVGATQIDAGEMMVWYDTTGGNTYLVYNDATDGVVSVQLN